MKNLINENRFFEKVAPFLFSTSSVLPEMVENSIRAKSTLVNITLEQDVLKVSNNGQILEDFTSLFVIADSNYDEDVAKAQKPAGMGILSVIAASREVQFCSGNKKLIVNSELYFNNASYRNSLFDAIQENDEFVDGMSIDALLKKDSHLGINLKEYYYYDIDLIFNDEQVPTKNKVAKNAARKMLSPGVEVILSTDKVEGSTKSRYNDFFHEGFVIWHGKVIPCSEIKPFTLVVNGETDLVSPVLPDRTSIVISKEKGKKLALELENKMKWEISDYILSYSSEVGLSRFMSDLKNSYSLDHLETFYGCKKNNEDSIIIDKNVQCSLILDGNIERAYSVNTISGCAQSENIYFLESTLGNCLAPSWVLEKMSNECVVKIRTNELSRRANTHYIHRDCFKIVFDIEINGNEIDGILIDDEIVYFTEDFDCVEFESDNFTDSLYWEFQSQEDFERELEEDFKSILSVSHLQITKNNPQFKLN